MRSKESSMNTTEIHQNHEIPRSIWPQGASALRATSMIAMFTLAIFVHGAIPFFTTPTLGQALWIDGFARSFANDGLWTIFASSIGAPQPAAISFGLSGAWPVAALLSIGFSPADAYTLIIDLWLALAMWGAYKLAKLLEAPFWTALIGATAWICLPIVWWHSRYSMLSIGFALLPAYHWTLLQLLRTESTSLGVICVRALSLLAACLVAVFMDGYTFVMFAIGSGMMLVAETVRLRHRKLARQGLNFSLYALCFGLAYMSYAHFVGRGDFNAEPLDFFRAFGLDPTYALIPTRGISWLADTIHYSVARPPERQFGDASVWSTTFFLPALVGACWIMATARRRPAMIWCAALIALLGFYLALGPSLNLHIARDPGQQPNLAAMPAESSGIATGTGWISQHVPGLRNMRASYRWAGLGALGLWLIIMHGAAQSRRRGHRDATLIALTMLAFSLPRLGPHYREAAGYRQAFEEIDAKLVTPLRADAPAGALLAILPWGNDFLATYLAPSAGFNTFNIGGDKNLAAARKQWPAVMRDARSKSIDGQLDDRVVALLESGEADIVMLPYFDLLVGAHQWPAARPYEMDLQPVIDQLSNHPGLQIHRHPYFTTVTLSKKWVDATPANERASVTRHFVCLPPECLKSDFSQEKIPNSQVGLQTQTGITTTAKAGYLLFGPYVSLSAGLYRLKMYGEITHGGGAYTDISSSAGKFVHTKIDLPEQAEGELLSLELNLDEDVTDAEIRVFARQSSKLTITSYKLERVNSQQSHILK
ncbi:hypothetical protein [Pseudoxanthomonas sp.]|uniref:hypothetical protein n=1 Tax=Pseudoxanthomonas sp. TaxID=1871049 RepID=UPI002622F84A|nr:hypothetical protein [Pseudoxanthomonas sp.]WDS35641.1 MAG: hypothetical protein O8I58_15095 [Pseudoxanthomonas sp.]